MIEPNTVPKQSDQPINSILNTYKQISGINVVNMGEFYKMKLIPDNAWHNMILSEYTKYKEDFKPKAAAVTYLIYSGISHPAFDHEYFTEDMADSYANAFQVHQKPCKTASIHKYWIRKLPYIQYLILVAAPVDIYAHTYQMILGEHDAFLEGGAFFIPYMVSHWTMLSYALFASYVYKYVPIEYWTWYFQVFRLNLIIHEYIYRLTLRKLTLVYRIFEFSLFVAAMWYGYKLLV